MSTPLLATKLFLPPKRPKVVLRPRLIERLMAGIGRKLTLVSASAGFGKTTLVSEWANGAGRPTAWLSLDEGDSDPIRFLAYFVAALRTVIPSIGAGLLTALQSPQPPPIESVMTTIVNDVSAVPDSFMLVLDDYHLIDSTDIDGALIFLVEHLPPQMHLVIVSREDPNLPLPRLRVRGQLTELRAADLRFTVEETADFLNRAMGLSVTAKDIAALEGRTEGWIAGLQLAALALQGEGDNSQFIQSFRGSHRFVLDYLVEEVLQQQPERVQTFLLHTSILGRLCGPLCDAVLGILLGRVKRCWLLLNRPICLLCRWIMSGAGIAIIIFLAICCGSDWSRERPFRERPFLTGLILSNCTSGPASGLRKMD